MKSTEIKNAYRILVWKHEGKRPLWIPRNRKEYNINICLKEISMRAWTSSVWLRIRTGGALS
jgi:hypothetical protein